MQLEYQLHNASIRVETHLHDDATQRLAVCLRKMNKGGYIHSVRYRSSWSLRIDNPPPRQSTLEGSPPSRISKKER